MVPRNYVPAYCLVDGVQVDFEASAEAALQLETEAEREKRHGRAPSDAPPLAARAGLSTS